jgi:hypothetical protein
MFCTIVSFVAVPPNEAPDTDNDVEMLGFAVAALEVSVGCT